MTEKKSTPGGLGERGCLFWLETVEKFELSKAELALLQETSRTLDDLDRLADAIARDGAMVTGSAGQPVVNPALTEARGQRQVLHRLISALGLPDDDGVPVPTSQTIRARTAAAERWKGRQAGGGGA